ncbi:unnamed protein product [Prorocentrum cordatum]|uniref:Pentacotripeptide-repeat region of PRORP domain-containing protein n=1 Tax=Prorocentrum cordatum TaxID=2364126 RepID=A0ABN9RZW1_9DINO|nr:unnamed protein product [Polarella glacialis]
MSFFQLQRWDQRVRESRAMAAGAGASQRDAGGEAQAKYNHLRRGDQCVRKGRAVAASFGAARRDAGGDAGAQSLIMYNAGISACEKGEQWQRSIALLSEMLNAKLVPDVITYSAGISACVKGVQWQRALALLREMCEAKLEPDAILYGAGISACEKMRAVAVGSGAAPRDAGCEAGAERHQLQRWDQRVREGRAVAAGYGAAQPDAGGWAGARHYLYTCSYNAGISAYEKCEQWQRALALLREMREAKLEPDIFSYSAGIGACEKGEQWERAVILLSEIMWEAKLQPNVHMQRCDRRVQEGRAVAASLGVARPYEGGGTGARRPQLQL